MQKIEATVRQELINGLREFANFLEMNPEAPLPTPGIFDVFMCSKSEMIAAAKIIGGKLTKHDYLHVMCLRREFGPIHYDLNIDREQVCEKIVTGTRVVPAQPATLEHEEEIVEWRCKPIMTEASCSE